MISISDAMLEVDLLNAHLPIMRVEDGVPTFSRRLTSEEEAKLKEVILPRRYEQAGCTDHELITALWELVVERNPQRANLLQATRNKIRAQFE